jgi:hypothetical protein
MKALKGQAGGGDKRDEARRNTRGKAAPQNASSSRPRLPTQRKRFEEKEAILDHADNLAVLRDRIFGLLCAIRGASFANEDDRRGLIQISEDICDAIGKRSLR